MKLKLLMISALIMSSFSVFASTKILCSQLNTDYYLEISVDSTPVGFENLSAYNVYRDGAKVATGYFAYGSGSNVDRYVFESNGNYVVVVSDELETSVSGMYDATGAVSIMTEDGHFNDNPIPCIIDVE